MHTLDVKRLIPVLFLGEQRCPVDTNDGTETRRYQLLFFQIG